MNRNKIQNILLFVVFSFICLTTGASNYDSLYKRSLNLQYSESDSSIMLFLQCLPHYEEMNDSNKIINIKIGLIRLYSGHGKYQNAYDIAWSLIPMLNNSSNPEVRVELYLQLSSLYIIFGQFDKAHSYIDQAISTSKFIKNEQARSSLISKIYAKSSWLNMNEKSDFKISKELLLKALQENSKFKNEVGNLYFKMQLAELYIMNDSILTAQSILQSLEQRTKNKYRNTHSLLFDHFGQLYMKKEIYDSAAMYFHKSINAIDRYKNHLDNKVEILDSLSSCYHYMGKNELAYYYSRKAIETRNSLFGIKNSMNKELFEIKDKYQDKLESQKMELLEQEQKLLRLKIIIYISIFTLIFLALAVWVKLRAKKQLLLLKHSEYELATKNKELVSSALQLVEREALLEDVRNKLISMEFKEVNQKVIKEMVSSMNANKSKKWNEFEHYFTQVNEDYYKTLISKYPTLSSTDLKMCALIKLGLSSKEMADLMLIGTDSVNTARSRIRKKMNLSRDTNLIDHLREIR